MPNIDRRSRRIDAPVAIGGGGGLIGDGGAAEPVAAAAPQPGAPQAFTTTGSWPITSSLAPTAGVFLTWRRPLTAGEPEKYQIEWSLSSGFTNATMREAARGQNSAAVDGLPPAVTVYFRIRAVVRGVVGVWSSTVSILTADDPFPPDAPTSLQTSWNGRTGDLSISWTNPTNRNFRYVRLRIRASPGGTILREVQSTVGRYVWTLAQQFDDTSGAYDPSVAIEVTAFSARNVASLTDLTGTVTLAVPAAPSSVTLSVFPNQLAAIVTTPANVRFVRYRYRIIQTSPSASDVTIDADSDSLFRAVGATATYRVGVRLIDALGQVSAETLSATQTIDVLTIAELRAGAIYADSGARSSSLLFDTLALDNSTTSLTFNSGGWVQTERAGSDRYGTITVRCITPDAFFYVATSLDGVAWRWFARSGAFDGRNLVEVANEAAAQAATVAFSGISDGRSVALPAPGIDARFVRLYLVRTGDNIELRLFYPRRLVEADDIRAESITAIQLAAGSVTAGKISVSQLSAIAADLGTITAGTVTGATVQTAASGQRVELTSANGLRGFDSGGTVQVQISAASGRLLAGGGSVILSANGIAITGATDPISLAGTNRLQFLASTTERASIGYGEDAFSSQLTMRNDAVNNRVGSIVVQCTSAASAVPAISILNGVALSAGTPVRVAEVETRAATGLTAVRLRVGNPSTGQSRYGVEVEWDNTNTRALVGFFNNAPIARPTVTGSRGGNAALASLCTQLANLGLITNSTT